jgi:hypothetical protein
MQAAARRAVCGGCASIVTPHGDIHSAGIDAFCIVCSMPGESSLNVGSVRPIRRCNGRCDRVAAFCMSPHDARHTTGVTARFDVERRSSIFFASRFLPER